LDLKDFNLIVIDTQGYELEGLKGACKTLENVDYVISEINKVELYEGGTLFDPLRDFMASQGFELVEQIWADQGWGEGLFIKNKTKI
jgi:hypothetical protein